MNPEPFEFQPCVFTPKNFNKNYCHASQSERDYSSEFGDKSIEPKSVESGCG
jgi:hypothetical protein